MHEKSLFTIFYLFECLVSTDLFGDVYCTISWKGKRQTYIALLFEHQSERESNITSISILFYCMDSLSLKLQ